MTERDEIRPKATVAIKATIPILVSFLANLLIGFTKPLSVLATAAAAVERATVDRAVVVVAAVVVDPGAVAGPWK